MEKKSGARSRSSFENIPGEIAVVGSLFDDDEIIGPAKCLPHLGELRRQQPAEKRTHADIGKVIAPPPDRTASRAVIAKLRVIERLLHEPLEGDGTGCTDRVANEIDQNGIAGMHRVELLKKLKRLHG